MPPISAAEDLASGTSSVYGKQPPPENMGKELFVRLEAARRASIEQREMAKAVAVTARAQSQNGAPPLPADYVGLPPEAALAGLSEESRRCIKQLAAYTPEPDQDYGPARLAAVAVALYQRPGETTLRVLLTTRATHLRRNPGQTALPGGKVDPEDLSHVGTARREAWEEVGLPLDHPDVYNVAVLDPVLTVLPLNAHLRNHIIVTPVVVFISDTALIRSLKPNPDEVDCIFDHPLRAVYTGRPEGSVLMELVPKGGDWWPLEDEYHSLEDRVGSTGAYRMHRFRTRHTPIRGFTSDVLIYAAQLAYGKQPSYGHFAPDQPTFKDSIAEVVQKLPDALAQPDHGPKRPLEWGKSGGFIPSAEAWAQR